jgi:DNA primase
MDANEYALKVQPPLKSLGLVIRKAEWLGKGERPDLDTAAPAMPASARVRTETSPETSPPTPEPQEPDPDESSSLVAEPDSTGLAA